MSHNQLDATCFEQFLNNDHSRLEAFCFLRFITGCIAGPALSLRCRRRKMYCHPFFKAVPYQLIQVNDTGGGVTCLRGVCVSELRGDGGGLEQPASVNRLIRMVGVVVVVRLKVLLAHEQLADNVERSVYIHVQSK